jgi:hypothetical protein
MMNGPYHTMAKQALTALAPLALAACASPAFVSPVEVTRFVAPAATTSGAPLGQGTITVRAAPGTDGQGLEFGLYRAAVSTELERLGYRVVPDGGAQVATVSVTQSVVQPNRRGPVSVGGAGSVGSWGSGVGLGLGIDLSGRPQDQIDRQVSVAIRPADSPSNLWEGRARFTATGNSAFADAGPAATRAATALFTGFPGQSGETIEVE